MSFSTPTPVYINDPVESFIRSARFPMRSVPDLFGASNSRNDIERYYSVYLIQLLRANRTRRAVEECRSIRRFARNHGQPKAAIFTFPLEMDAYNRGKQNVPAMCRVLRSWDRTALVRRIELAAHRWSAKDRHRWIFVYAPCLLFSRPSRLGL